MKINSKMVAVLSVVILVGGFYVLNVLFADHLLASSGGGGAGSASGQSREETLFSGELTPDSIKGSFTVAEIAKYYDIEMAVLNEAFSIEGADIETLKLGGLHDFYEPYAYDEREIGTSSMKLFVALYKDMPYEVDEPTYLTTKAVDILLEKGNLTIEQKEYLKEHTFEIS